MANQIQDWYEVDPHHTIGEFAQARAHGRNFSVVFFRVVHAILRIVYHAVMILYCTIADCFLIPIEMIFRVQPPLSQNLAAFMALCAGMSLYWYVYKQGVFFWVGTHFEERSDALVIPTQHLVIELLKHASVLCRHVVGCFVAALNLSIVVLRIVIEHWFLLLIVVSFLTS